MTFIKFLLRSPRFEWTKFYYLITTTLKSEYIGIKNQKSKNGFYYRDLLIFYVHNLNLY